MNKIAGFIIGVIVLVVIIGGVYSSMNSKKEAMIAKEKMEQQAMADKKMAEEKVMMKDETTKADTMIKSGSYEVYAPEKVALASATHAVVLFFKANWCPSCRAVDASIKANLSNIPSSLTILDVNYDNSASLKKKYGVTYQHTFVQVDKDGKSIKKWSGSPTLSALVAEVK
ncbi:MAG: thioredoxin [Candidatus Taylorbacteria bacterium]|nr:thioredoxin [Candidatus Taylorbacteria bacterium]